MRAASASDGDKACRPASKVVATNGTPRQILAKITDQRAFQTSPRKSMFAVIRPILFSDHGLIENCGSNSHQKAIAESTVGTMKGTSTTARMIALKGSRWFTNRAERSLPPNFYDSA